MATYYLGDETVIWAKLIPGDSVVVPGRINLELSTIDREAARKSDERCLVVSRVHYESHHGLGTMRIYLLSPTRGLCYYRRNAMMDQFADKSKTNIEVRIDHERQLINGGGW